METFVRYLVIAVAAGTAAMAVGCDKQETAAPQGGIASGVPGLESTDEGGGTATGSHSNAQILSDDRITAAVQRELFADTAVNSHTISVDTIDGVVELTGTTDNLLTRDRATRLASIVKGVRSITNRIRVEPIKRPDEDIKTDVEKALFDNPAAEAFEVNVSVNDQYITLSGTVDSWQERALATLLAKAVRGVRDVTNRIDVDYDGNRSDFDIRADVKARLKWDALVDDGLVNVKAKDGRVSLSGVVGSLAERDRAFTDAWVAGTRSVSTDGLRVEWWAKESDLRGTKYVITSDSEIHDAIKDALLLDPRVNSFQIEPNVRSGSVVLSGEVNNVKARRVAEDIATNTTGVVSVDNNVVVDTITPVKKALLETRLKAALLRNPFTSPFALEASVDGGLATISGQVDTYSEKAEAEDIASSFEGVTKIHNDVTVKQPAIGFVCDPYAHPAYPQAGEWYNYPPATALQSDLDTAADIREQLFWSPFVDEDQVQVNVVNGVATLTGTVDTMRERLAAAENALDGGALRVDNQLRVADN